MASHSPEVFSAIQSARAKIGARKQSAKMQAQAAAAKLNRAKQLQLWELLRQAHALFAEGMDAAGLTVPAPLIQRHVHTPSSATTRYDGQGEGEAKGVGTANHGGDRPASTSETQGCNSDPLPSDSEMIQTVSDPEPKPISASERSRRKHRSRAVAIPDVPLGIWERAALRLKRDEEAPDGWWTRKYLLYLAAQEEIVDELDHRTEPEFLVRKILAVETLIRNYGNVFMQKGEKGRLIAKEQEEMEDAEISGMSDEELKEAAKEK